MREEPVYIVDVGVVSPWGNGMAALTEGLRAGRCMIRPREFEGIGAVAVGTCDFIPSEPGEDRAITLLRPVLEQLAPTLDELSGFVSPERRAVCAATSKGGMLLYLENPARAAENFLDLLPDAPARFISSEIDSRGPRQALVGACATGLQNVFRAAEWIRDGHADFAIAGSTEATLTTMYIQSFLKLGALNREGCFPYDKRHAGFVAGEGAALFVLVPERLLERLKPRSCVRLENWTSLGEAHHPTAIATDGMQIVRMVNRVVRGTRPDLISTHGTATLQNDAAEAAGLKRLYGDTIPPIFATKGAIGHLMGATAAVELAACVAAMTEGFIPPTVGFDEPAEEMRGLPIQLRAREMEVKSVLKWSLGFGGHLAACVIYK